MGYGVQHSAEMPVVGVTAGSEWADLLVAVLDELRETLDAKVTPAGIDINADLSFRSGSTYYAATNLKYVGLYLQTSLAAGTYPGIIYKKGASGDLYYNNDAGDAVQISSGSSVAAAAGNISGTGYGASGVEIAWVAADAAYQMRSGAGANDLADVVVDDVFLNDGSANYVRLTAQAMASDYSLVFPAAVPSTSNSVMATAVSGSTVTASFTGTPTLTTLTTTGAITAGTSATVGTTLGVTGLITATAGVTAAAGQHFTTSTTGQYKHGSRTIVVPGAAFCSENYSESFTKGNTTGGATAGSGSAIQMAAAIPLPAGKRITQVVWHGFHGTGVGTRVYAVYRRALSTGSVTVQVTENDATSNAQVTVTDAATLSIEAGNSYWLLVQSNETSDTIYGCEITYDEP